MPTELLVNISQDGWWRFPLLLPVADWQNAGDESMSALSPLEQILELPKGSAAQLVADLGIFGARDQLFSAQLNCSFLGPGE